MLDLLRKNTQSFVIYLLFAIIIVVFVFTFNTITPSQACGDAAPGLALGDFGEVGDTTIDNALFNLAAEMTVDPPSPNSVAPDAFQRRFWYENLRFPYLQRFGFIPAYQNAGSDPEAVSPIRVEKVMEDLIEHILVQNEAEALGLNASAKELTDRLLSTDAFFDPDTGEFLRRRWESAIRGNLGVSPVRFEQFVKGELLREKLITLLTAGVVIADHELAYYYRAQNEKVDLSYIGISPTVAESLTPTTAAEVSAWQGDNADAIKAYFDANQAEYSKPERVVVRGIQFKAPNRAVIATLEDAKDKAAKETARADVQKRAEGVYAQVKSALDALPEEATTETAIAAFAGIAETESDHEGSKVNGGQFEPRSREAMGQWPFGPEASEPAFSLEAGVSSELIEVDSGFWILMPERRLAAETKGLKDVEGSIATKLLTSEKANTFAPKLAEEVLAAAKAAPDQTLEQIATAINTKYGLTEGGLSTNSTGPFSRMREGGIGYAANAGVMPGLGEIADVARDAFATTTEKPLIDRVFTTSDGRHVVARMTSRIEAETMTDEAVATIREQLIAEKKRIVYRAWYQSIRDNAEANGDISYTDDWHGLVKASKANFVDAGGILPGTETASDDAPPAEQATDDDAEKPAEGAAPADDADKPAEGDAPTDG
jgi:hypothetical protein